MLMKNDLQELAREKLKLPDSAVITQAMFRISEHSDDIQIIGATLVEFQNDVPVEDVAAPALIVSHKKSTRRGPRREFSEKIKSKSHISKAHAVPGVGGKITDAQVKGMRAVLHARKNGGNLSDNQLAALKNLEGIRAPKMTPEMRQQLKDIVDDSTVEARAGR